MKSKNIDTMNWLAIIALCAFLALLSATSEADGDYEYVYVPEGMELRIVPVGTTRVCVEVKAVRLDPPPTEEPTEECSEDGLVFGPPAEGCLP